MYNRVISIIFASDHNSDEIESLAEEIETCSSSLLIVSLHPLQIKRQYDYCQDMPAAISKCNSFVKNSSADVLLISGSGFQASIFNELSKILNSAERHGAVSPRGSNMGMLSVPPCVRLNNEAVKNTKKNRQCYNAVKDLLPEYSIIPYASSVCALLKGRLIEKFGFLDEKSATITEALASWCLNINQYGYSSITANKFFIENDKMPPDVTKQFNMKFPYAEAICDRYINYSISTAERFATVICAGFYKKPRVLLCLYQLAPIYNGTSEHALAVAGNMIKNYSHKYDFTLLISKENADFFNAAAIFPKIVHPDDILETYHIGITFIQIYFSDLFAILNNHCLKIISTVLDLISYRCSYFSVLTDSLIFKKSIEYSDGIITISNFTKNDLKAAFPDIDFKAEIKPILITAPEYSHSEKEKNVNLPFNNYILVFGNTYKHKSLANIYGMLQDIEHNFIIVGYSSKEKYKNIHSYPSGRLTTEFIYSLYKNCSALLFPSEYEGYGLPIMHALNFGKKVIISRTEINRELQLQYPEYSNQFIFFDTFNDIKTIIESTDFTSETPKIGSLSYSYNNVTSETEKFISEIIDAPIDYNKLKMRDSIFTIVAYINNSPANYVKGYIRKHYPSLLIKLRKISKHLKSLINFLR